MRYMLMMHAPRGTGEYQINSWSQKDLEAHMDFMHRLNKELTDAGELVGAEGLTPPGEARVVRAGKNGVPAVTDGPFPDLALYEMLEGMSDNPMVALSRAIAAAMVHGPEKGLELLEALDRDARVSGHYRLDAVRGHLFERAGDHERALVHYLAAAERTASIPERDYLLVKAVGARAKRREMDPVGGR